VLRRTRYSTIGIPAHSRIAVFFHSEVQNML
jgi:hypothetical protein